MQKKVHIKKGDTVLVLSGDSKGVKGRVLEMILKKDRVLVEGVNIISKHTKPNAQYPNGGIIKKEAPVHISNVMLIDPATGEATRTGKKIDENNKLVRYSKQTGEVIK